MPSNLQHQKSKNLDNVFPQTHTCGPPGRRKSSSNFQPKNNEKETPTKVTMIDFERFHQPKVCESSSLKRSLMLAYVRVSRTPIGPRSCSQSWSWGHRQGTTGEEAQVLALLGIKQKLRVSIYIYICVCCAWFRSERCKAWTGQDVPTSAASALIPSVTILAVRRSTRQAQKACDSRSDFFAHRRLRHARGGMKIVS